MKLVRPRQHPASSMQPQLLLVPCRLAKRRLHIGITLLASHRRQQLRQPLLNRGVIVQVLGKGIVAERLRQARLERFSGSGVIGQSQIAAHHMLQESNRGMNL